MSWWRRWRRRSEAPAEPSDGESTAGPRDPRVVPMPSEPYVFECRDCGKVFEARRRRAQCPECDGYEVELLSD
ncbi:MAG TPA: hypothetical protein VMW17_01230 [Candidatus Binatia bacterium]|nr:hypothetical protein [Candidatus Binatia bacterium]